MDKGQYTTGQIQEIYKAIVNSRQIQSFADILKQNLLKLLKIIKYDDKGSSDLFYYICEIKFFEMLLDTFTKNKNIVVIIHILEFISTILNNVHKQQTIHYILSSPCLISLQIVKFGNMSQEIADYYINFLKTLSRMVNPQTLPLMFNKKNCHFPLLYQNIRFFNHPESLIRITTKTNILSILKQSFIPKSLTSYKLHQYFVGFPFCIYYLNQSNFIKEYWKIISEVLNKKQKKEEDLEYELQMLEKVTEDHEEQIHYVNQLLEVQEQNLKQNANVFMESANQNNILESFRVDDKFFDGFFNECLSEILMPLTEKPIFPSNYSKKLIVYLLSLLFKNITNRNWINYITIIIFSEHYQQLEIIIKQVKKIRNKCVFYQKQWKFKGFLDSYEDKVKSYCKHKYFTDSFIISDLKKDQEIQKNARIKENQLKVTSIQKKEQINSFQIFGNGANLYENQIQNIENIFNISIVNTEEKVISKSCISKILGKLLKRIESKMESSEQYIEKNIICENIFDFLKSKDDSLIMLTANLLNNFYRNSNVLNFVKQFCQMQKKSCLILRSCLGVFEEKIIKFRICTYAEVKDLIKNILKLKYQFDQNHFAHKLKSILKQNLNQINTYLYKGKQWEKVLDYYILVSKQNKKRKNKTIKVLGLIKQREQNYKRQMQNGIGDLYENLPQNLDQQIAYNFWIFVLVKELISEVKEMVGLVEQGRQNRNKQNDSYYNSQSEQFVVGQAYVNSSNHEKIDSQYKRSQSEEKYVPCELILLPRHIIVGVNQKVQLKHGYESCTIITDKSDPRKILMRVEETNMLYNILIQNVNLLIQFKKHIQDMRSVMRRYQFSEVIKEVNRYENIANSVNQHNQ